MRFSVPGCFRQGVLILALLLVSGNGTRAQEENAQTISDPGPRWGHTFVYDPIRDEVVLFGGTRQRGEYLKDTWTWNGRKWEQHEGPGPSARGFSAAAFHAERGVLVLHGGRAPERKTLSDTWQWDGAAWSRIEESGPYHADHHRMVHDPESKALLAFGGWGGQDVLGQTWQWDGRGWKPLSGPGPRKRAAFGMAYDTGRRKVVLHGGLWINGQYADVWEWAEGQWQQLGGPYDNSSLDHHSMIYDSKRGRLFGFGGKNYRYQPLSEAWTLTGSKLEPITREGPSPRHSVGLTFDARRGRAVLYGGKEYRGDEQVALSDLWIWDGELWRQESPESTAP